MKRTRNYNFIYLELGDVLYGSDELERWSTADFILKSASSEGVKYGLTLSYAPAQRSIQVAPGACWVDSLYLVTGGTYSTPALATGATYGVYAVRETLSKLAEDQTGYFYTESRLGFHVTSGPTFPAGAVTLGKVYISPTNSSTINTDDRVDAIFGPAASRNAFETYRRHKHTGSPSKISLTLNVQGVINTDNLPRIPATKLIGDPIFLTPSTTPKNVSHIGRVKDKCVFESRACWTKDYIRYYTDPWPVGVNAAVYKNGVRIYDGFVAKNSVTRSDRQYGEISFPQALSPSDRIEVATEFFKVKASKGPWAPSRKVSVYVNGKKVDSSSYTTIPEEGVVQFFKELSYGDTVHLTVHEEYITDTGDRTHYELDDDFGTISSFLGWRESSKTEFNSGVYNLYFIDAGSQPDMTHQVVSYKLPDDMSEIDKEVSTLFVNGDLEIVTPDGGADLQPVDPITIYGGDGQITTFGQSFKATTPNVSRVQLYMSASKSGLVNKSIMVGFYTVQNGLPNTFIDLYNGVVDNIPVGGGVCTIHFNPPIPCTIGNSYAFIFEIPEKILGDEAVEIMAYRASEDYPDGVGHYTMDQFYKLPVNIYGSDDWWFLVSGSSTTWPPPPPDISTDINFDDPPKAVVNPAISLVIDCSGSNKDMGGTDTDGLRIIAAKNFIQNFINTYNAGETDPDKKAVFNLVYFTDLIAGHDIILDSTMLSDSVFMYPPSFTSDTSVLFNFLDRLKDPDTWGGGTPLNDAIMYSAMSLRQLEPWRKKVIIVLTDGMENASLNEPDYIITNYLSGDDSIKIYSIAFGSAVMLDSEIDEQARLLSRYGYYYNDISNSNLNTILNSILNDNVWGLSYYSKEHDFGTEVYLKTLSFTSQLPGSSRIKFTLLYKRQGEDTWNTLYEGVDLSPQITFTINKLLRYLRFEFELKAGSEPVVQSFTPVYQIPRTEYLFTKPIVLDTPLQVFSVFERADCLHAGDALDVEVRVSPSAHPYWGACPVVRDKGKGVAPARLREPCIYVSDKKFRAKNGAWDGYYKARVYLNGTMLKEDDYFLSGPEGIINFKRSVYEDDKVEIDIYPDNKFRIAVKIVHTKPEAPLDLLFGCMYTKNTSKFNR
ncbi:MAG: vWA domain-containing protein [Nitrososphaerota archaeon]